MYLIASVGGVGQVLAGLWDVYFHATRFREMDPPLNPAHLALYAGVALALVPSLLYRRYGLEGPEAVRLLGIKLVLVGVVAEVIAGTWNEIYHFLFTTEPALSPPHSLMIIGMMVVNVGLLIGVSLEYSVSREAGMPWKTAFYIDLIFLFASMWLLSSGSIMYLGRVWRDLALRVWILVGVAFVFTLVMICAARVLHETGSLLAITTVYSLVNYYFLVIYAGVPAYAPLALISGLIMEAAWLGAKRIHDQGVATLALGLVGGAIPFLAYYPFSQYLLMLQPDHVDVRLLAHTSAGLLGAMAGSMIIDQLSAAIRRKAEFPTSLRIPDVT